MEENMDRNKELLTVYILWKKLNELQNSLFDYYGTEFLDMHIDERSEEQKLKEDIDWPF
jgi:hypothetical protein